MLVYSQADKKRVEKATQKARLVHPRVKILGFGQFEVVGTTAPYKVAFHCKDGELEVECGCEANANGQPCYHASSVAQIYKLQVRERSQDRTGQPPMCGCGNEAFAFFEGRWHCMQCITMMEEAQAEEAQANAIETEAEKEAVYTMEQEARDRADIFG